MPSTPTILDNGSLLTEQQAAHRAQKASHGRGPHFTSGRTRYRGRHSKSLKRLIEHLKGVYGRDLTPGERSSAIILCTPWAREERR